MRYTILLVEDEPLIQALYSMVLKMARHTVVQAGEEAEALKLYRSAKPSLVLLDLMIPSSTRNDADFHDPVGYEVLKLVKSGGVRNRVKVVVLSNLDSDEHRRRAAELGADDYWVKASLDPHDLPVRVDSIMAGA